MCLARRRCCWKRSPVVMAMKYLRIQWPSHAACSGSGSSSQVSFELQRADVVKRLSSLS
ncbi:hypothetical protein AZ78_3646 [Lysobacter capsici AZ78]|uniref:Uncharacterized protein n=1 Tax=Lysobacter capsici AZ78 TaxID=1444315 RepID=A0A108UBN1_9GAMM|nr:hypothetical protein AZ78_3646 [Lysobacter capsici AZ78]